MNHVVQIMKTIRIRTFLGGYEGRRLFFSASRKYYAMVVFFGIVIRADWYVPDMPRIRWGL